MSIDLAFVLHDIMCVIHRTLLLLTYLGLSPVGGKYAIPLQYASYCFMNRVLSDKIILNMFCLSKKNWCIK